MSSSNESNSKRFTAVFLMTVNDVGSLFAQRKELISSSFTSPNDPRPVHFKLRLAFGTDRANLLGARVMKVPPERNITVYKLRINIYGQDMNLLKDLFTDYKRYIKDLNWKADGWSIASSICSGVNDWRVMCEVAYESTPGTDSEPKHDLPLHHKALSQNMLDLLNDEESADVTLHFSTTGEEIKAHKTILIARSVFFRSLFKSGMKESRANEVELDDDPWVFKELLKFLYSGLLPGNMDEIAMALFPVADKYVLDDLKQSCKATIRHNVSRENVMQVLRLAEMYDCPDLFEHASSIFKENLKDLDQSFWDELENESSRFLAKLLKICSK